MPDEIARSLSQIADLLRQRVELAERVQKYQEDRHRDSEERMAKFKDEMPKIEVPDIPTIDHKGFEERMQRHEKREEEDRQARRQFEERLLAELTRHNVVLERILARFEQGG